MLFRSDTVVWYSNLYCGNPHSRAGMISARRSSRPGSGRSRVECSLATSQTMRTATHTPTVHQHGFEFLSPAPATSKAVPTYHGLRTRGLVAPSRIELVGPADMIPTPEEDAENHLCLRYSSHPSTNDSRRFLTNTFFFVHLLVLISSTAFCLFS